MGRRTAETRREEIIMIHREVEEFYIRKLEQARDLVSQVAGFYYLSANSRGLYNQLHTIEQKLTSVIYDAREWQRTHDKFGNSVR